ncbi:exopolyphosphatase / guanosine-5'-triphosphate,3'-diphosphate pyrophosphatase [Catalinimonas alkaloidigena]|uniref:Exopolyphosphatase / guanosine-5'-triphosphate,3'-diphosphate pyrophosphatase n=1 Tax=Catalinimonas alkaloidigena TaxID=1075417 RepID=A0A1G9S1Y8_9BACT|nr:phosphatase [Catalinimonas alkaloidigena]SDM29486.1 exopolyphosphatase / guanosine-5'-triphosphate,3'-diphosphate pyrophosphatase [Catalinimonas alkaloidigena]
MKLAAIDAGSNAVRLQITEVIEYRGNATFKRLEYIRFPLRLGLDVFNGGEISPMLQEKFLRLMQAFKIMIDLYNVDDVMACATSAMREALNGHDLVARVAEEVGIDIEIIDGKREAEITNAAIIRTLTNGGYLHIDVGGGSTELNVYYRQQKVASESFRLGSVRNLQNKALREVWQEMTDWIQNEVKEEYRPLTAVGTGGNILAIYELAAKKNLRNRSIDLSEMKNVRHRLEMLTLEERLNVLMLPADRADVIVPASEIYLTVMKLAKAKKIQAPEIGLKDGMLQVLYERQLEKRVTE